MEIRDQQDILTFYVICIYIFCKAWYLI